MAQNWNKIPARPLINMEPNYEEIHFRITAEDVRNASYWSLLATPMAGISYGANGIWPWIQEAGELVENHGNPGGRGPSTWYESMAFPGSIQIGSLSNFIQQYDWWTLKPLQELLTDQPGLEEYDQFISVAGNDSRSLILVYTPTENSFSLRLAQGLKYDARWFDPITGNYRDADYEEGTHHSSFTPPGKQDWVLVLKARQ
jgi:hypothetical protein